MDHLSKHMQSFWLQYGSFCCLECAQIKPLLYRGLSSVSVQPKGVGWGEGWEDGPRGRALMYTCKAIIVQDKKKKINKQFLKTFKTLLYRTLLTFRAG